MGLARDRRRVGLLAVVVVWTFVTGVSVHAQEGASVALASGEVAPGETAELEMSLVPPRGLQRFDLTLIVANGSVAEISGVSAQGINPNFVRIVNQNPTSIRVQGVDLDNQITSTDEPIVLLTIALTGIREGTTELSIPDVQVFDEKGSPYSVDVQNATLQVVESASKPPETPEEPEEPEAPRDEPQPLPGSVRSPQDLDGDGLFEDTDGDGTFTAADVALFALEWNSQPVQSRPSAFDFNGNGQVDGEDPFALAELLESSQANEPSEPTPPNPTPGPSVTALELTGGPFFVDETTTVTLRLIGAPSGLQSYRVRLRSSVGIEIVEARGLATASGLTQVTRRPDGALEIPAVDVEDRVSAGVQDVALAEIDVRPRQPGDAEISLDVVTFIDDQGRSLEPFVRTLSASVTPVVSPIGDAENPPRDLNGDGLYEDVDGDGELTDADVILLALNLNSAEVQDNASLFDFNGDGAISFADVQALRSQLASIRSTASDGLDPPGAISP